VFVDPEKRLQKANETFCTTKHRLSVQARGRTGLLPAHAARRAPVWSAAGYGPTVQLGSNMAAGLCVLDSARALSPSERAIRVLHKFRLE
jgi:hypothetical protein